jgi:hypothetical protein
VHVKYGMAGVGEEGIVLMQPDADGRGRVVTAVLPKGRGRQPTPRAREHVPVGSLKLKLQLGD